MDSITNITNLLISLWFLESFHLLLKWAFVISVLKKEKEKKRKRKKTPQLDPQLLSNNCPVSILTSFYFKIAQAGGCHAALFLLQEYNVFDCYQAEFRSAHYAGTALAKVFNNLFLPKAPALPPESLKTFLSSSLIGLFDHF